MYQASGAENRVIMHHGDRLSACGGSTGLCHEKKMPGATLPFVSRRSGLTSIAR
jgi:hypothetical protein